MTDPTTAQVLPAAPGASVDASLEWLVTNGIGGYAAGLVGGGLSRRFHGVLIASLPAPMGRMMCLNLLRTSIIDGIRTITIEDEQTSQVHPDRAVLSSFVLEQGLPVWRYLCGDIAIEKRLLMPHGQNTTHVIWRIANPSHAIVLRLEPAFQVRVHEGLLGSDPVAPELVHVGDSEFDVVFGGDVPITRFGLMGSPMTISVSPEVLPVVYAVEHQRGYEAAGTLRSFGCIDVTVSSDLSIACTVSTEPRARMRLLSADEALEAERERRTRLLVAANAAPGTFAAEMTIAADQFIVAPVGRAEELVRAEAVGDDARTILAGYHWFTDWGRDTMISLEGLTMSTGRWRDAESILRAFSHHIRDGLIPNLFPEGAEQGLYHTADATLWFFHALERYVRLSGDRALLSELLPRMVDVLDRHVAGTAFGIGVDPADGLLHQGAAGYQLTWMDAKVGDWVVTPRRGKAVEINALWYNAQCLLAGWLEAEDRPADAAHWRQRARATAASFNRRFWNPATGCLFDVVDGEQGDDPACRPNQIFALSLDHPVLDPTRAAAVLDVVRAKLLTPFGLRSLAPDDPAYQPRYDGDRHARDAAYHQGTVWAWLIGPFIDAWRRLHPLDVEGPCGFLTAFTGETNRACVGTIGEIFDAEPPFSPRGCVAQAWSVAEVLRTWRSVTDVANITHPQADRQIREQLANVASNRIADGT